MLQAKGRISSVLIGIAFLVTGCGGEVAVVTTAASSSSGDTVATSGFTLQGSPTTTVAVDTSYDFAPAATGSSGTLSYSISGKPEWATFSTSSGELTGSPQAGQEGSYGNIVITATDGSSSRTIGPFAINVVAAGTDVGKSAIAAGNGTGSATLAWDVPTQNSNGSALVDLAGYKIYYGNSQTDLSQVVVVGSAATTSYVVEKLGAGTYYFAISSYNTAGAESAVIPVGSKTIS